VCSVHANSLCSQQFPRARRRRGVFQKSVQQFVQRQRVLLERHSRAVHRNDGGHVVHVSLSIDVRGNAGPASVVMYIFKRETCSNVPVSVGYCFFFPGCIQSSIPSTIFFFFLNGLTFIF